MELHNPIFSIDELSEIENLKIRGGVGINTLAQERCVHNGCAVTYPSCVHDKCTVHDGCSGPSDKNCTNIGCTILKPQNNCLCHLTE